MFSFEMKYRQLYQKIWEFDKEINTLFVDFKKAYDSIHRESLINILKEFNFPQKLVNLVSISTMETVVKIKVGNMKSDPVTVKSGLRQGIKLRNSAIPLLAFSNDIVLMDESQNGVKRLRERLNDTAQKVGLQINEQKIEYIIIGRQNWMDHVLEVNHFKLKRVNSFKYFGSINPVGKRPLGKPKLRWEDIVKRDIEDLLGGANWKDLAMNRDGWRIGCETGWS
ncbi:hypothetical protein QTP88_018142 [Uroleucon formosanum]